MYDVFISYATEDETVAQKIREHLEGGGLRCWIAPRDISPGIPYGEAIISGIDACTVLVLVFSRASNESVHVLREVERSVSKGKSVLPFRIEDVMPSKGLEYFISSHQFLDAVKTPLRRSLERLEESIAPLVRPGGDDLDDVKKEEHAPPPRPGLSVRTILAFVVALTLLVGGWAWFQQGGGAALRTPVRSVLKLAYQQRLGGANPALSAALLVGNEPAAAASWRPAGQGGQAPNGAPFRVVLSVEESSHVFLVHLDSEGALHWLYPANASSTFNAGGNPVAAGAVVTVPPDITPLRLGSTDGVDHLYIVATRVPWPQLEEALWRACAEGAPPKALREPIGRGARGEHTAGPPEWLRASRARDAAALTHVVRGKDGVAVEEIWIRHERIGR